MFRRHCYTNDIIRGKMRCNTQFPTRLYGEKRSGSKNEAEKLSLNLVK